MGDADKMNADRIIVLGARGSYPTPSADRMKYGGNTTAFVLPFEDRTLFVDAGSGVISCGLRLANSDTPAREIDFLFTHYHLDHISGLPSFAPLYMRNFRVRIHLPRERMEEGMAALRAICSPPYYPVGWEKMEADISFHELPELFEYSRLSIQTSALCHPGGSLAYRIDGVGRSVVLATDTEHHPGNTDRTLTELCGGADHILYDAHYTDEEYRTRTGWGHSTWREGVRLAKETGAERLTLVHHNPDRNDGAMDTLLQEARGLFPGTDAAYEGMVIPLTAR